MSTRDETERDDDITRYTAAGRIARAFFGKGEFDGRPFADLLDGAAADCFVVRADNPANPETRAVVHRFYATVALSDGDTDAAVALGILALTDTIQQLSDDLRRLR